MPATATTPVGYFLLAFFSKLEIISVVYRNDFVNALILFIRAF